MCKPHTCKCRGCEKNSQVCGPFYGTKTLEVWKTGVSPLKSAFSGRYGNVSHQVRRRVRSLFDIFSSVIPVEGSRSVWPVVDTCFIVPLGLNTHKQICVCQKSPKILTWACFLVRVQHVSHPALALVRVSVADANVLAVISLCTRVWTWNKTENIYPVHES